MRRFKSCRPDYSFRSVRPRWASHRRCSPAPSGSPIDPICRCVDCRQKHTPGTDKAPQAYRPDSRAGSPSYRKVPPRKNRPATTRSPPSAARRQPLPPSSTAPASAVRERKRRMHQRQQLAMSVRQIHGQRISRFPEIPANLEAVERLQRDSQDHETQQRPPAPGGWRRHNTFHVRLLPAVRLLFDGHRPVIT